MSLLQNLSYQEYKKASEFNLEQCEVLAKLADLRISFKTGKKPGELLIKTFDRYGYSVEQYKQFLATASNIKTITTYYRPYSKVAILIANDNYKYLSKLATPSEDCDILATELKKLGFIVITLKNMISSNLKHILKNIFDVIPQNSYCFIFYAGHGCEVCSIRCILTIDCPSENVLLQNCVTENFILNEVSKFKPEMCVLIMDMCRAYLNRNSNPKIYSEISTTEDYTIDYNLIIGYSTQSSQAAYEVMQIDCSTTIDSQVTYEWKTGDTGRIVPGTSQYVNALLTRLPEDLDISSLLDSVHRDVETSSFRRQRPIKVQCGVAKRSLYDPVTGDIAALLNKLKEVTKEDEEFCTISRGISTVL